MPRGENDESMGVGTRGKRGNGASAGPLDYQQILASPRFDNGPPDPAWRTPSDFDLAEARAFTDPEKASAGALADLDPAIAVRLLRLKYDGDFWAYNRWYRPTRRLVVTPEKTCPGMTAAAELISERIDADELIAVYCDYDVDGTTAGEALRRGLAPYGARLMFGYADAQSGFGLTTTFVEEAARAGARVLVTLDCGSGQPAPVKLARRLGMTVVVVDHHSGSRENEADHHLNPSLRDPASSLNTGSQLAWKFAAAIQQVRDGKTRPELWREAMYLAGLGCLADMGPVTLHENRAFYWLPSAHPPAGVVALAEALAENPHQPGGLVKTTAALNLAKRTPLVATADIAALLAVESVEEARPLVERLLEIYEAAKPKRKEMIAEALEQTGIAEKDPISQETRRPNPEELLAFAVLDNHRDYVGYTGVVAGQVSKQAAKPAIVFAYRGVDEFGQHVYKFSGRDDSYVPHALGGLLDDAGMREACTLRRRDEAGEIVAEPVLGGHEKVIAGACTREQIPSIKEAAQAWAEKRSKGMFGWFPSDDLPLLFVQERCVDPGRLEKIEQQARQLAPFSRQRTPCSYDPQRGAGEQFSHREPFITVEGELRNLEPDPESPGWLLGELMLGDGNTRPAAYPADVEAPVGRKCEWMLRLGISERYYLRGYHELARDREPHEALA